MTSAHPMQTSNLNTEIVEKFSVARNINYEVKLLVKF